MSVDVAGFAGDVLEHPDALFGHQHVHGAERVELAHPDVQHQLQRYTDGRHEPQVAGQPAGEVGQRGGRVQFGRPARRFPARERLQSETLRRRPVRVRPEQVARAAHHERVSDIVLHIVRG